jgi:uncharacterized membrane protein
MAGGNNRSIADVLQDILVNVQTIIRSEVRLAKTEVTEDVSKAGRAAGIMGGGLVGGLFTVWLLLLTSLFALSTVMPFWAAALVLLVIMAVVTAILLTAGKKRFKTVHLVPEKTIETMRENVEWVKSQSK